MLKLFKKAAAFVISLTLTNPVFASGTIINIPVRPNVEIKVHYLKHETPSKALLILLPGGAGGLGGIENGEPKSNNFLIRSRTLFYDKNFDVVSVGRASDQTDLTLGYRVSSEHVSDLKAVITALRAQSNLPIWLIGTSRGTISGAAAAIDFGQSFLSGLVFTSSVTVGPGALNWQDLDKIGLPTLVLQNKQDECKLCPPSGAASILRSLKKSAVKKLIMVEGGEGVHGDPCEAFHYHGFMGIEPRVVDIISDWIDHPSVGEK
jgi:pimeloyl-ACP methyl ester carboxylesterase